MDGNLIAVPVIPSAIEAEKGLASIAVNHPKQFESYTTERNFDINDVLNPLCKAIIAVIFEQTAKNASTDVRVVFEKTKDIVPSASFAEISQIWQHCPVYHAIDDFIEIIRNTSKRRRLLQLAVDLMKDIGRTDNKPIDVVSGVATQADGILRELIPVSKADTKSLLMNAIERYENGEDQSQRINTGFSKIDNITPIRYGDFLVIGGQEKSGKSMLATNIIANLLTNQIDNENKAESKPSEPYAAQDMHFQWDGDST